MENDFSTVIKKSRRIKKQPEQEECTDMPEETQQSFSLKQSTQIKVPRVSQKTKKEALNEEESREPVEGEGEVKHDENSCAFLYAIRLADGSKSDEHLYYIGCSNDVPEVRKALDNVSPTNVKTDYVVRGNASDLFVELKKFVPMTQKKGNWYNINKKPLEEFFNDVCARGQAEKITEGKAKIPKTKKKSHT